MVAMASAVVLPALSLSSCSSSSINKAIQTLKSPAASAAALRFHPLSRSTSGRHQIFPSIRRSDPFEWTRKDLTLVGCLPSTPPPSSSGNSASPAPTRLYINGLSYRTTQESLRNAFQNFGQIVDVNLVMDRIANRPKGFAFIRYSTVDEAKRAMEGMHGKFLDGRVIFVEVARTRSEVRREKEERGISM